MTRALGRRLLIVVVLVAGCTFEATREEPPPSSVELSSEAPACAPPSCRGRVQTVGQVRLGPAQEISGLVASRRNPGLLYAMDDGRHTRWLLVVSNADAEVVGRLRIAGLDGRDTEALAAGPCNAGKGTCIYIGDIGDNQVDNDDLSIIRFAEPDLRNGMPARPVGSEQVSMRYPDGPHDAEALLVDPSGRLLIVTKEAGRNGRGAARLYVSESFTETTLSKRSRVPVPWPDVPLAASVIGNVVTGADSTAGAVVLRTYDQLVEYRAPSADADLLEFASWPASKLEAAPERQGEAVAYGLDGCTLFTMGEGDPRLSRLPCRGA